MIAATVPGTDTARDVGIWTAAALGVLAVLRVIWRGLVALIRAHELVAEQQKILDQQRAIQARMVECLAEAKAQARDLDRVEERMEYLERLAMRRVAPSPED